MAGIGATALLALLGLRAPASRADAELSVSEARNRFPDTLVLRMNYGGVGAEGVDLIWRGTIGEPVGGQATIRLAYAGAPDDRGMPVWPVTALLFFSADDYRSSFIAELNGTMDWQKGEMVAVGQVTDGTIAHTRVEQVLQLQDGKRSGRLAIRFVPDTPGSTGTVAAKD
jgi:hypothetical protein